MQEGVKKRLRKQVKNKPSIIKDKPKGKNMNPFINQVASKETIELMGRFFEAANRAVERANYKPEILEAFDLIQAISCYRYFPTVDECVRAFPSLTDDKHKVQYIWDQFDKLEERELSDIYIKSLAKLELSEIPAQKVDARASTF